MTGLERMQNTAAFAVGRNDYFSQSKLLFRYGFDHLLIARFYFLGSDGMTLEIFVDRQCDEKIFSCGCKIVMESGAVFQPLILSSVKQKRTVDERFSCLMGNGWTVFGGWVRDQHLLFGNCLTINRGYISGIRSKGPEQGKGVNKNTAHVDHPLEALL